MNPVSEVSFWLEKFHYFSLLLVEDDGSFHKIECDPEGINCFRGKRDEYGLYRIKKEWKEKWV